MKKVIICGIDTAKLPKINDKQCREYFVRLANGDMSVREELIVCNMRLVLSVMRRFNTAKVSADDMFQAGVIGLIKAIDNFNLAFDVSPSTYIVPMMFV